MKYLTSPASPGQDTLIDKNILIGRTRRNVKTIIAKDDPIAIGSNLYTNTPVGLV